MVRLLSFCSDRFKSKKNFLGLVKLHIANSNTFFGSFFVQMMKKMPYLQRWILLFVFYICENPGLLFCFSHISTNERPYAGFQVPLLHLMMYVLVVNIPARVSLSNLDICSVKRKLHINFSNKFLARFSIFSPTWSCILNLSP